MSDSLPEAQESEVKDKFNAEEYAYLKNSGFTSEIFKIEIQNMPVSNFARKWTFKDLSLNLYPQKFYGYAEVKKLMDFFSINFNKIKIPWRNSKYCFVCFRNEEGDWKKN